MAKKGVSPLLIAGIGVGALYLLSSNSNPLASIIPTGNSASIIPGGTTTTQTQLYGVNNGTGVVSNYAQLVVADPNLGNPNYQMTDNEVAQYLANYLDLQQGLPSWIGHKQHNGVTPKTLQQAAQVHWTTFGCAEKRIFLPLQPPSNKPYVPPPKNAKSSGSGSSWIGPTISAVGTIVASLLGPGEPDPVLNDGELQVLFTGGKVLKDILPMFADADPMLTKAIDQQFTALLLPYA